MLSNKGRLQGTKNATSCHGRDASSGEAENPQQGALPASLGPKRGTRECKPAPAERMPRGAEILSCSLVADAGARGRTSPTRAKSPMQRCTNGSKSSVGDPAPGAAPRAPVNRSRVWPQIIGAWARRGHGGVGLPSKRSALAGQRAQLAAWSGPRATPREGDRGIGADARQCPKALGGGVRYRQCIASETDAFLPSARGGRVGVRRRCEAKGIPDVEPPAHAHQAARLGVLGGAYANKSD